MSAETAFAADLTGHAGHFGGKGTELLDHRVQRFFQLQDFAADVDRNFLREIAVRNSGCDFGDISDLAGEVAGHEVDVVGEIFPGSGDTGDLRLAAEFAVGAHFAGYTGDFSSKCV